MLSWAELNRQLMKVKTEEQALAMLKEEQLVKPTRPRFVTRIFRRYRKLRSKNELKQLGITGRQATAVGRKK